MFLLKQRNQSCPPVVWPRNCERRKIISAVAPQFVLQAKEIQERQEDVGPGCDLTEVDDKLPMVVCTFA